MRPVDKGPLAGFPSSGHIVVHQVFGRDGGGGKVGVPGAAPPQGRADFPGGDVIDQPPLELAVELWDEVNCMTGEAARAQRSAGAGADELLLLGQGPDPAGHRKALNGQFDSPLDPGHELLVNTLVFSRVASPRLNRKGERIPRRLRRG